MKRFFAVLLLMPLLLLSCTKEPPIQSAPEQVEVLAQWETLVGAWTDSDGEIQYPADFAGSYLGEDGYLHINVTSSTDDVSAYTAIVDASLVRFHTVAFSYAYLQNVHQLCIPLMRECDIYEISVSEQDNKVYVYTNSDTGADAVTDYLNEKDIAPDSYRVIVEENSVVVASTHTGTDTQDTDIAESTHTDTLDTHDYPDVTLPNRTSAAKICMYGSDMFYANVYDSSKLYKYNIESDVCTLFVDSVFQVRYISIVDDMVYFSGTDTNGSETVHIYRVDISGQNLVKIIENAKGAYIHDGFIYYHDYENAFAMGISRQNLETGATENLISVDAHVSDMTINIYEDNIYYHDLMDIYKYNIPSKELTNITNGQNPNGINKLQLVDGYLYYYTYGVPSSIKRIDIATFTEETVLTFNTGDFWFDNLLVTPDKIVFTGRQNSALAEGKTEADFVRGTFLYDITNDDVTKLWDTNLGPTCHIVEDYIVALFSLQDKGTTDILVVDFSGNDCSADFPNLTMYTPTEE